MIICTIDEILIWMYSYPFINYNTVLKLVTGEIVICEYEMS